MVQFLLIMAVVAAICASENTPQFPLAGGLWRLALAAGGMLGVAAFALVASRGLAREIRDNRNDRSVLLRRFGRLRAIHATLWLGVVFVTLYGLGWTQLVRCNWQLNDALLVRDLLVLLPIVLPLVASWAAFYEVDRSLLLTSCGAEDPAAPSLISRSRYLALHARHYLALVLLPVLTLLAVQDVARMIAPTLATGDLAGLLYLPPLVLMFALFPLLLAQVWRTTPLASGPLRARLEEYGRRAGFRPRQILVWHTDRTVVNAAVAGFLPHMRYVFLTDSLLAHFSDDEVEAVFGHEIGHIRHHHLVIRLLTMLLPVGFWIVCREAFPDCVSSAQGSLARCGLSPTAQAMLFAPIGLALFGGTVFAMVSKLLELEADLFACRADSQDMQAENVSSYLAVLEKLSLATGQQRTAGSWLHPSIAERAAFLQRLLANPRHLAEFERRRQQLSWLLAALAAGCCFLLAIAA